MSRVETLIAQMTLAEKLGQLTMAAASHTVTGPVVADEPLAAIEAGTIGNVLNLIGADHVRELQRLAVQRSRLGIPVLFALDITHGYRTLFPVSLAAAGMFDPPAWEHMMRAIAQEAAAEGIAMTFAPMLDVARDPRWGRTVEGPGEDPWVAARMAQAMVRGLQSANLAEANALAAVAKHYCAYGAVTGGREYASVDLSERTVLEVHEPPFAAAVAAGAAAIMPAFTDLAGIPMTANARLLERGLRARLGFTGVLVSDYNAIGELMAHGIAGDLAEAAALALDAGVDIDMMSNAYRRGLPVALERGRVRTAQIDAAVRRVLTLKERLGLFDDPFRRGTTPEADSAIAARRVLARSCATRALIMLTNEHATLPLCERVRRLAVIGPLADVSAEMRGPWWAAATPEGHVTVLEGLRAAFPEAQILHAEGVAIEGGDSSAIGAAIRGCAGAEAIVLCIGEAATMSGEAASRAQLDLPGRQRELAEAVLEHARAHAVPVVAVLFSGRPLAVPWLTERADAVLAAWFLGSEAGNAIADVLSGKASPSGRTPVTWPRALGQIPIFYAQRPSGRPSDASNRYSSGYRDETSAPLFPFGHGLTYGRFRYASVRAAPLEVSERDTIEVRVELTNEGTRAAEETVFLFAHDKLASVARPQLELKAVAKVALAAGASATVSLGLPARDLRFLGADLMPRFEPGEIELLVGPCAERARLIGCVVSLRA